MQHANDNQNEVALRLSAFKKPMAVSAIALMTAMGTTIPAFATMDNTFTVLGDSPSGTDDVTDNVIEQVDLEDATTSLTLTKAGAFAVPADDANGNGLLDAGDVVTYTYVLTNAGTVSLDSIALVDTHDGSGSLSFAAAVLTNTSGNSIDTTNSDQTIDRLDPGDVATFTATYTVTVADVAAAGADGDLDNSAVANGVYDDDNGANPDTPVASNTATEELDYNVDASLDVTKVASDFTDVEAGDSITYTYRVINDGNVPVTAIALSDVHQGNGTFGAWTFAGFDGTATSGTSAYTAGAVIDALAPGDAATFTRTYLVTQDDVDTLQ